MPPLFLPIDTTTAAPAAASVYPDGLSHLQIGGDGHISGVNVAHEFGHCLQWAVQIARYPKDRVWSATNAVWTDPTNSLYVEYAAWRPVSGTIASHLTGEHANLIYEMFADTVARLLTGFAVENEMSWPWPGDDAALAFLHGLFPAPVPVPPPPAPTPPPAPVIPPPAVTPPVALRAMFDSTTYTDIPPRAPMVAGYIDGIYRWPDAAWSAFPGAVLVRIAINVNTRDGHVGDVEWGDMTVEEAVTWCHNRRADGYANPTVYLSESKVPALLAAFDAAGEPYPLLWVAHYGATPVLPTIPGVTVVALQYANEVITAAHYDLSVVAANWPGVDGGGEMTNSEILAAVNTEIGRIVGDPAFTLQDTVKALKGQESKEVVALRAAAATLMDGLK